MHIYIVRHGQTLANVERLIAGHQDFPLTEMGVDNSVRTGQLLNRTTFNKIHCSDLGRTKDTLLNIGHTSATFDKRLRERDFGVWSGKLWSEYIDASKDMKDGIFLHDLPGVESNEEMNIRLKDFLADLVNMHEKSPHNENVLIVSHKGTIRALVCLLLENSSYDAHNVQSTNCPIGYNCVSHFELEISDKTIQNCKVLKLFDCSHLI